MRPPTDRADSNPPQTSGKDHDPLRHPRSCRLNTNVEPHSDPDAGYGKDLGKPSKSATSSCIITLADVSQPPHLADSTLSSYFDLSFSALPHKVLMPEQFEEAVVELRRRFTDRSREDYVFQPAYHKRIPADGVGFYMEGIWVSLYRLTRCTVLMVSTATGPHK